MSLSVMLSLGFGLIAVWLIASMLGRLPFEGLSNSANDSLIVQYLDQHLPPIPAVFAVFSRQIDPNSPPQVFIQTKTQVERYVPNNSPAIRAAAAAAKSSIVRITSFGCGGIIAGSGFVAAPGLVITNAHVIAGAHRPIVKYGSQSYAGTPVLFDPYLDVAVLRLSGLHAKPLTLVNGEVSAGMHVAVLGYPGGNYTVIPGVISNVQYVLGSNLYGVGVVERQVYEVQAVIASGNSGGPMILQNGQVAGVIFGRPDLVNGYGFALTSLSLVSTLQQAQESTRRVSTGVCLSS
jgi:S1-C subfamily serine protease